MAAHLAFCRRSLTAPASSAHSPQQHLLLLSPSAVQSDNICYYYSPSTGTTTHRTASAQSSPANNGRPGRISVSPSLYSDSSPPPGLALRPQGGPPIAAEGRITTALSLVPQEEERGRGAAVQLWRRQTRALYSARCFGSGGFSHPTPHIRSGRVGIMASGSSTQTGGLATSSENRRGDALKFVTYEVEDGQSAVGIARGDALWSLQDVLLASRVKPLPQISDMASLIKNWGDLKDRLVVEGSGTKLSEVKLLAPIPRPTGVIMCIGKNYLDHVKEVDTWKTAPEITKPEAPKHPIVFTKAPQSVIGPGAAIKYPHGVSSAVDYEAELGVIIGKAGHKIKREDAIFHIFGYTIINDVTAREVQKRHQQWFLGKSCDTFCPMGPAIVPASELDGSDLRIQCWINDELRQDGRTSQMIFGIPELIEVISSGITIQPGDIIATGTPAGVGSGFNPPRHLSPGDEIRISIEGIGELLNTVE